MVLRRLVVERVLGKGKRMMTLKAGGLKIPQSLMISPNQPSSAKSVGFKQALRGGFCGGT